METTPWSRGLSVTADAKGVVPLAGSVAVRLLAARVGLTAGLSVALARRDFTPVHDRGRVWVDVATMLAAGGEAIADIETLRHASLLSGPVASAPTVWRTLDEATDQMLAKVGQVRARVRRRVWQQLPAGLPPSRAAGVDLGGDGGARRGFHPGHGALGEGAGHPDLHLEYSPEWRIRGWFSGCRNVKRCSDLG